MNIMKITITVLILFAAFIQISCLFEVEDDDNFTWYPVKVYINDAREPKVFKTIGILFRENDTDSNDQFYLSNWIIRDAEKIIIKLPIDITPGKYPGNKFDNNETGPQSYDFSYNPENSEYNWLWPDRENDGKNFSMEITECSGKGGRFKAHIE